jgi:hypothetical protein
MTAGEPIENGSPGGIGRASESPWSRVRQLLAVVRYEREILSEEEVPEEQLSPEELRLHADGTPIVSEDGALLLAPDGENLLDDDGMLVEGNLAADEADAEN